MAEIIGYSERGLVNALFESIVQSSNPVAELSTLLGKIIRVGENELYPLELNDIDDFTVHIEHSLSDFGDPDVILILSHADKTSTVLFIEAKLETFESSCRNIDYTKNGSKILQQLFLKANFVEGLIQEKLNAKEECLNVGFKVYKGENDKKRKIGSDPVVHSQVNKLRKAIDGDANRVLFVALTTDCNPPEFAKTTIDTVVKIYNLNKDEIAESRKNLAERLCFWNWMDIYDQLKGLPSFFKTAEWNDLKMRFPVNKEIRKDIIKFFENQFGLIIGENKSKTDQGEDIVCESDRDTYYPGKKGKALFTCGIIRTFTGYKLDVYWRGNPPRLFIVPIEDSIPLINKCKCFADLLNPYSKQ